MKGRGVNVNGHMVNKCHIEINADGSATATALVDGKQFEITYAGNVVSEMGVTDGKPWLRKVRVDMALKAERMKENCKVIKFIDRVRNMMPKVDDNFINMLRERGVVINGRNVIYCNRVIPTVVNGSPITQLECIQLMGKAEESYIEKAQKFVDNFMSNDGNGMYGLITR